MNDRQNDELRELFRAERAADEPWTPPFERVMGGPRVRARRRVGWLPVLAAAGLVAAAVAVGISRQPRIPALVRFTAGQLRTPTDFLLNIQGAELLTTVPKVGNASGWYPLPPAPRRKPL